MHLRYLFARFVRHLMPEGLVRFLLRRRLIISPGLETSDPAAAVARYREVLSAHGRTLAGQRVLVFGYGGRFAIACELLKAGAGHVVLVDKFAIPDERANRVLYESNPSFLILAEGLVRPDPSRVSLFQEDVRDLARRTAFPACGIVVSSSVYEHLPGEVMEDLTRALARLTAPGGVHIHFVDLRDHYFKYPFEMLRFREAVWRRWLNPSSNLNRFRLADYRRVFEAVFAEPHIEALERDLPAFERARPSIRPEFLSGDPQVDAVTKILVVATAPRA